MSNGMTYLKLEIHSMFCAGTKSVPDRASVHVFT